MSQAANRKAPLVLAFDTSTVECQAALVLGEDILAQHSETMPRGQAEALLQICEHLLQASKRDFAQLDAIGVGVGPGNFTGIRISVAAARGLALGLGIPAVGVSSFDALRAGTDEGCTCVIEAPRDQCYVQSFDSTGAASAATLIEARDLSPDAGLHLGFKGRASRFPPAVAIAHVAQARYLNAPERPAPLYLRPPDAAPARDRPPNILS